MKNVTATAKLEAIGFYGIIQFLSKKPAVH